MKKYKKIQCVINGTWLELPVSHIDPRGWKRMESIKFNDYDGSKGDCFWPWRFMQEGDSVLIPWGLASRYDIRQSYQGYSSKRGDKFASRVTEKGFHVFCVKRA